MLRTDKSNHVATDRLSHTKKSGLTKLERINPLPSTTNLARSRSSGPSLTTNDLSTCLCLPFSTASFISCVSPDRREYLLNENHPSIVSLIFVSNAQHPDKCFDFSPSAGLFEKAPRQQPRSFQGYPISTAHHGLNEIVEHLTSQLHIPRPTTRTIITSLQSRCSLSHEPI